MDVSPAIVNLASSILLLVISGAAGLVNRSFRKGYDDLVTGQVQLSKDIIEIRRDLEAIRLRSEAFTFTIAQTVARLSETEGIQREHTKSIIQLETYNRIDHEKPRRS